MMYLLLRSDLWEVKLSRSRLNILFHAHSSVS